MDRALTLKEAAALLGVSYSTVYAHKLEMGFFQVGNQWRIWPDKLKSATEYNSDRPARTDPRSKKCQSESAKVRTSGTSISARQAGTPLNRLMELGGWAKYEHVLRYAHLAPDHLAEHANMVTIWAQSDEENAQTLAA